MLDSANTEQKTPVAEVLQSDYSGSGGASASGSSASQSKSKKVSHLSLNTINTYEWKLIKGKLEDWSEKNQDTFDELITLWIGGSNHPVSLFDSPEFRAVIGHANSKVELSLPIFFIYIDRGHSSGQGSWFQEGEWANWENFRQDSQSCQGLSSTMSSDNNNYGFVEYPM